MFNGQHGSAPDSGVGRNKKLLIASLFILVGILVFCLWIAPFSPEISPEKSVEQPVAQEPAAKLVTVRGVVLVRPSGGTEWKEVKSGAHLLEGDLVRTETSGEAAIRYRSGTSVTIPEETVFTVQQPGSNVMEIGAPPGDAGFASPLLAADGRRAGSRPSMELHQVVRFGRTLELIGRVEPGSSLAVNDQIVEVTGEGSFKHFTHPFPASTRSARLNLKVTDLAGRSRVWTATYNFGPHGGED